MPASGTTKTLRPAELTQILPTGLLVGETRLELGQIPGIIFHFPRSYILGSPESSEYPSTVFMDHPEWSGTIVQIRIDPGTSGAPKTNLDSVGLDYVRILPEGY